ncbi:MAG: POTRA domain-containing protein, partial [Woeseiaceae bacterium]
MNVPPFARYSLLTLLLACTAMATAGELRFAVEGIADPLKNNVLSHVDAVQIGRKEPKSEGDYAEFIATAEKRARAALRPYGYYMPAVKGRIKRTGADAHLLTLNIQVGQPVTVDSVHIEVVGEGAKHRAWQSWRDEFPLRAGSILNQVTWEEQKKL